MSTYTNTVCARATNALVRLNKELLTTTDVAVALSNAGIDSIDGMRNYTSDKGYLTKGRYLIRVVGGWVLSDEAKTTGRIVIKVTPGMATGRVYNQVVKATKQLEGFVEIQMEV